MGATPPICPESELYDELDLEIIRWNETDVEIIILGNIKSIHFKI